jgi:hypothetical protein
VGKIAAAANVHFRSPLVHNVLDSLAGRAMVIGVDRLDYSKGLVQRMDAFERFLAVYPDWRGKVTYLQITPKSRSQIEEHADMERTISEAAGRVTTWSAFRPRATRLTSPAISKSSAACKSRVPTAFNPASGRCASEYFR